MAHNRSQGRVRGAPVDAPVDGTQCEFLGCDESATGSDHHCDDHSGNLGFA